MLLALLACAGPSAEPTDIAPGVAERTTSNATPPPKKGTLRHWPETTAYLLVNLEQAPATVELGPSRPTGLEAFWSIASTQPGGSGFFYSDAIHKADETRVAYAASVRRVQDIRDASTFDYSAVSVGPVPEGGIVLVHHLPSNRYLALVIDRIEPTDARTAGAGPYAYADVTWYLTEEGGGADFSAAL